MMDNNSASNNPYDSHNSSSFNLNAPIITLFKSSESHLSIDFTLAYIEKKLENL